MERVKRTLSNEIIYLLKDDIVRQMEKGRSQLAALLVTTKWSTIAPIVGGIGLGILGWKRADKIKNSKDIITHPWESTKILLGFKEPEPEKKVEKQKEVLQRDAKENLGKQTQRILANREESSELSR